MLVSGFTIIRNGFKYDFPFLESIQSVLPICDEFIVNVGKSEDATKQAIEQLRMRLPPSEAEKIKVFESVWPLENPEKKRGGQILSDQTNLALEKCQGKWCFYLQADELLHEEDLAGLRAELIDFSNRSDIEGVVLNYVHFYGSYQVIQTSRSSYRREIRIVRGGLGICSIGDAQSFRHSDGRKIRAVLSNARVFHYGWVRPQEKMKEKTVFMDSLYQTNTGDNYRYKRIVGLKPFRGSHPSVMTPRIQASPTFDFKSQPKVFHWKDTWKLVSGWVERATGYRPFEYKNYILVRK